MPFTLSIHDLQDDLVTLENVERVDFISEIGHTEILPGHESLFAALLPPKITYYIQGKLTEYTLGQGFIKFEGTQCDIWAL